MTADLYITIGAILGVFIYCSFVLIYFFPRAKDYAKGDSVKQFYYFKQGDDEFVQLLVLPLVFIVLSAFLWPVVCFGAFVYLILLAIRIFNIHKKLVKNHIDNKGIHKYNK